jgi:hypothetical protein
MSVVIPLSDYPYLCFLFVLWEKVMGSWAKLQRQNTVVSSAGGGRSLLLVEVHQDRNDGQTDLL